MDPFEARVRFSKQLRSLVPSKAAAQELVRFLFHNADLQRDIFPAVQDSLRRTNLNGRMCILQFLYELVATILDDPRRFPPGAPIYGYVNLTVRSLPAALAEVLPQKPTEAVDAKDLEDMRCLTNLREAHRILTAFCRLLHFAELGEFTAKFESTLLTPSDVLNIKQNRPFDERFIYDAVRVAQEHLNDDSAVPELVPLLHQETIYVEPLRDCWRFLLCKKRQSQYERVMIDTNPGALRASAIPRPASSALSSVKSSTVSPLAANTSPQLNPEPRSLLVLSRKQILQRMEADRERQKRGKELLWQTARPENEVRMGEFQRIWKNLDRYDPKADRALVEELNDLYKVCKPVDELPVPIGTSPRQRPRAERRERDGRGRTRDSRDRPRSERDRGSSRPRPRRPERGSERSPDRRSDRRPERGPERGSERGPNSNQRGLSSNHSNGPRRPSPGPPRRNGRDTKDSRDSRDSRNSRDSRPPKPRDSRDSRPPKPRDSRDGRPPKPRDSRESSSRNPKRERDRSRGPSRRPDYKRRRV